MKSRRFTKGLCFLHLMSKHSIFSEIKISNPSNGSTLSLTTSSTQEKQVKTVLMDLSWEHCNSSLQAKTHICPQKKKHLASLAFNKFDTSPTQTNQTEPSFRKLNSSPTKLSMLFLTHLQGKGLTFTNLHSSSHCSLNGAKLHTFPLA